MKIAVFKNCTLAVLIIALVFSPIDARCLRPKDMSFSEKFSAIAIPVAIVGAIIAIPLLYDAYLNYCENQKSTPELLNTATDLATQAQQFIRDRQAIVYHLTAIDNFSCAVSVVINSRYGDHTFPYLVYADALKDLLTKLDRSIRAMTKRINLIESAKQDILEYEYIRIQQATHQLSAIHKKLTSFYALLLETKAYRQQLSTQQQLANIHFSQSHHYTYPNTFPKTYTTIGAQIQLS